MQHNIFIEVNIIICYFIRQQSAVFFFRGGNMFSSVITAAINGMNAYRVTVEADVSDGMPIFSMVGYLGAEVREAQERVRTAIRNMGFTLPAKRITVSLTPADLRKGGSGFDLPIALAVMAAGRMLPADKMEGIFAAGELGLDGSVNGIHGALEMVSRAASFGCHTCIIPADNLMEVSLLSEPRVLGAHNLSDVLRYLKGETGCLTASVPISPEKFYTLLPGQAYDTDFANLRGQKLLRRAAEIAVGGGHNLLLIGPPGAGKSMAARCIRTIQPSMTLEEVTEVTRIYSIAGALEHSDGPVVLRPFRAPHHTISSAGMAGGGSWPRPGEISLAHQGILYLDELPEFSTETIELLRGPLEDGRIIISRKSGSFEFPARVQLIASMNPCKCGYFPDRTKCRCSQRDVRKYLSRISQPLLDRIDMCMEVRQATYAEISGMLDSDGSEGKEQAEREGSDRIRKRVELVRKRQQERYIQEDFSINACIPSEKIRIYCPLGKEEEKLMEEMYESFALTGRSYYKILRVARTIADLEGAENIGIRHLREAAVYKMIDRKYWSL